MSDLLKIFTSLNIVLFANVMLSILDLGKNATFVLLLLIAGVVVLTTRVVFDNNLNYSQNIYSKPWVKSLAFLSALVFVIALFILGEWSHLFVAILFLVLFFYLTRYMKKKDFI